VKEKNAKFKEKTRFMKSQVKKLKELRKTIEA